MSIENSIDRLAAAIESLAAAVLAPVVVGGVEGGPVRVEPRPATEQEKAEIAAADAAVAKKPRGRPRKQANVEITSQEGVTVETKSLTPDRVLSSDGKTEIVFVSEGVGADGIPETNYELRPVNPQPAAQTADTATAQVGSEQASSSNSSQANTSSATAPTTSETTTGSVETISKADIVQILTGLQKKLEETATSIEEKRAAAQKCRDLIKSVVGTESLKDAKPEHFGRIKSAVLKVLNNE